MNNDFFYHYGILRIICRQVGIETRIKHIPKFGRLGVRPNGQIIYTVHLEEVR